MFKCDFQRPNKRLEIFIMNIWFGIILHFFLIKFKAIVFLIDGDIVFMIKFLNITYFEWDYRGKLKYHLYKNSYIIFIY